MVAPYLDMGNNEPANLYAAIRTDHLKAFSAGFVIGAGCRPAWDDGTAIAHDPAVNAIVTKAARLGATAVISFGGAGGKDLARSCTSGAKVLAGYKAVVKRFHPAYVDFDIEGVSLLKSQAAAMQRRLVAIRGLEKAYPKLVVSLTEPVVPTGLQSQVMSLLHKAKTDHVHVGLLNLMTMDYGPGWSSNMGANAIAAAKASLRQLRALWPRSTYANIGITPMIGVNDDTSESFSLAGAASVRSFARSHHVGRLAFWDLDRDGHCGPTETSMPPYSDCSSASQAPLAYTKAFLG